MLNLYGFTEPVKVHLQLGGGRWGSPGVYLGLTIGGWGRDPPQLEHLGYIRHQGEGGMLPTPPWQPGRGYYLQNQKVPRIS